MGHRRCLEPIRLLGDYIAVVSNNTKAQVLYTGNGPTAMDVFSVRAGS